MTALPAFITSNNGTPTPMIQLVSYLTELAFYAAGAAALVHGACQIVIANRRGT